jgi:Putative neutral zinc metallopeptidase
MRSLQMNSYISLIFEAEGAKERFRRLFQSVPEPEKPGCTRPSFSAELGLIVERSGKEVMLVERQVEFDASTRARLALKQTGLVWTVEEETAVAEILRQRPTCVAAFITSLGYFLAYLYP